MKEDNLSTQLNQGNFTDFCPFVIAGGEATP